MKDQFWLPKPPYIKVIHGKKNFIFNISEGLMKIVLKGSINSWIYKMSPTETKCIITK